MSEAADINPADEGSGAAKGSSSGSESSSPNPEPRTPSTPPSTKPRRRRPFLRWLLRLLVIVVILLLIAGVAIQIILSTDLPRSLVIAQLQARLGLRIEAASLSTGWLGNTDLRDVTIALPLADKAFLELPNLRISHTNLLLILLRRPLHIESIEMMSPRLTIVQDPLGRWNVQEAVALITRAAGGQGGSGEPAPGGAIQLPRVDLRQGTVILMDNEGKSVTLSPLEIHGRPDSAVSWSFNASLATHLTIDDGRIAPGPSWAHRFKFTLDDIGPVVRPWFQNLPEPLYVNGTFAGSAPEAIVTGRIDVTDLRIGKHSLKGPIGLHREGGIITLTPQSLHATIETVIGQFELAMERTEGDFKIHGSRLSADHLRVRALGGGASLHGGYDLTTRIGAVEATWADLTFPGEIVARQGNLKGSVDRTLQADRLVWADLTTTGGSPWGQWDAETTLAAKGPAWGQLDWTLRAPKLLLDLKWGDRFDLDLSNLFARVNARGEKLELAELRIGDTGSLRGFGTFDVKTREWWTWIGLRQRPLPLPRITEPADITLSASGDPNRTDIRQFELVSGSLHVSSYGSSYDRRLPKPLDAHVYVWQLPFGVTDPARRPITGGGLTGSFHGVGTLWPHRDVDLKGQLEGSNLLVGNRQAGDVRVEINGKIGPDVASIESKELELLEGKWKLLAQYAIASRATSINIHGADISAKHLDELVDPPPDATGRIALNLDIHWPSFDRDDLTMKGTWSILDLRKDDFAAEKVTGKVTMENERIVLKEIELRQGHGTGTARVTYDLNTRQSISLDGELTAWPVEIRRLPVPVDLTITGKAKNLEINIARKSFEGAVAGSAIIDSGDRRLATAEIDAQLLGRAIRVERFEAQLLGGSAKAEANIDLDHPWTRSTGALSFKDLQTRNIVEYYPPAEGLRGAFSGLLLVTESNDPRREERMRIDLRITPRDAFYNGLSIGDMDAIAFASMEEVKGVSVTEAAFRAVVETAVLRFADGNASLWGRVSRPRGERFFAHTTIELNELTLNELVHAVDDRPEAYAGRVHGELTLFGPPRAYNSEKQKWEWSAMELGGNGSLRLVDSDLLNSDIIGGILEFMDLRNEVGPRGTGAADLRIEQGALDVLAMVYRNKSISVRASGRLDNVELGVDSPISGFALGTSRPLRDLKLPFAAQVDDILAVLQRDATSFRIEGTWKDPVLRQAALAELSEGFRRFIVGDVRSETRGSAGR